MKKLLAMLLCLTVVLLPLLASCQTNEANESSTATVSDTSSAAPEQSTVPEESDIPGYNKETGKYEPEMPEYKWEKDKEFRVCVYSNTTQTTYFSEEIEPDLYDTTDQYLNEAVRERNNLLAERYNGVKIKAVAVDNVVDKVNLDIQGSTGEYDAAMPFLGNASAMAQDKKFYDLSTFSDYIDFSMPWWDQNFIETMIIKDKVYFAVGDISIMQKIVSSAIIFNKEMLASLDSSINLYDEVREGTWTLDRMVELAKQTTSDSDGVSGMTYKDNWGLSGSYGLISGYYLASGEHFVTKNSEGLPQLTLGSQRSVTVAQKLLSVFGEKDTWVTFCQEFGVSDLWVKSLDIFGENRCLFYSCAFSAIKKLRAYTSLQEWGILPVPKYDEVQTGYYTPCSAIYAYGITIPVSAPDPEFSAFMIEVMCAEAKNTITPAYYDVILKTRDMKDDDSEEMLDKYVFNNVTYDIGLVYSFGGLSSFFDNLIKNRSTEVASPLDSTRDSIQAAIDKVVEAYS